MVTLGFHPQTQKLEPHLLTQGLTLGVKGLRVFSPMWNVVGMTSYLQNDERTAKFRKQTQF